MLIFKYVWATNVFFFFKDQQIRIIFKDQQINNPGFQRGINPEIISLAFYDKKTNRIKNSKTSNIIHELRLIEELYISFCEYFNHSPSPASS